MRGRRYATQSAGGCLIQYADISLGPRLNVACVTEGVFCVQPNELKKSYKNGGKLTEAAAAASLTLPPFFVLFPCCNLSKFDCQREDVASLCASDWKLIWQFLELNSFNSQTDLENRLRQMPKKGETKKERERHIDRDIKVHFIRQTANELTLKLPASDIFATLWATGQEIYQLEQFRNLVAKLLCTGRIQSNRNGKRKIALLKLNSAQHSSK